MTEPNPVGPRPAIRRQIEALPRYQMTHCNEMGEDYMSRCYMVAEPSDGSDSLMAGREKWLRESDVLALLAVDPRGEQEGT